MKAKFFESKNCIEIDNFPLFLYSKGSLFKILNLLSEDFYISLKGVDKKRVDEDNLVSDLNFINISLVGKAELKKEEAEEFFSEMMNSLVSFEKTNSLIETESCIQ